MHGKLVSDATYCLFQDHHDVVYDRPFNEQITRQSVRYNVIPKGLKIILNK